ncbi:MAG: ubiquinol-cytochrome C chaperone family protein [Hyphomicrobium sp.]
MLKWFKTRAKNYRKADKLYGAIVTQARSGHIYASLGVPDTPTGRYEIVVLHLFLVLERLRDEPDIGQVLPRLLVEKFISDMDDSLRELGTGDLAVPKKVRRAAAGLYERVRAYRSAVAACDATALSHLLASYVFSAEDADWRSAALASYTAEVMAVLATQDVGAITAGKIAFPDVAPHKEDVCNDPTAHLDAPHSGDR